MYKSQWAAIGQSLQSRDGIPCVPIHAGPHRAASGRIGAHAALWPRGQALSLDPRPRLACCAR